MRKDIEIPKAEGVRLLAVQEFHEELGEMVWNIYLYNAGSRVMDTVMVVLRGSSEDRETSVMRKSLSRLEPGSYARLEILREELLAFKNEYLITYFDQEKMFEKNFTLAPGTIKEDRIKPIEEAGLSGIVFDS
ncbi:hypothetical protein E7Z59_03930 [Robertkochia marina]|uniref:Uncharacterized protein n=1 Tax=Robertkochia marina TaxID=1227945 RepID=A0A4S3M3Y4_9FLAO|nr:hypothetical protein [Robertkochia marina]THD69485.1 hypothetical protein E7Z59_03930 [Robertkochia marina]TRZ47255.1 hypothetical protein D3A96_00640 [Robertkochia marina]